MPSEKRSKKVQEKRSNRANFQVQRRRQQQQQQEDHLRIDKNLANILEDVHINPLDHQQSLLFESMLKNREFVITLGQILLVLIFLAILWHFWLLESFLARYNL
jgi:hypothetical protein